MTRAFEETQNRIQSMALVHQKLYESENLSRIDLGVYIHDLVDLLQQSYQTDPAQVKFVFELESVSILIDTAMPCGLILSELISNALKHAFPGGRAGEIHIHLTRVQTDEICFSVADDGVGMPEGFDPLHNEAFGLQMMVSLCRYQLQGQVYFDLQQGVTCQVCFRDDLYKERV